MIQTYVMIGMLGVCGIAQAGNERYAEKHQRDERHMIVVAEGEFEPRSIGSYTIRVYATLNPEVPTDSFVCGQIRPRDGVVEDVLFEDLDRDGSKEIVVTLRCVGTGSYLSADAFTLADNQLFLLAAVETLSPAADPIAALRRVVKKRR